MPDFAIEKKIYYHDTDCGGVVYYANYLKFLEEGRTEFCLSRGIDLSQWFKKGVAFVAVRVEVDYKFPAKYGETIQVFTAIEKVGVSSVHFSQDIKKDGTLLIKSKTVWACISTSDFKPRSIPEEVSSALQEIRSF